MAVFAGIAQEVDKHLFEPRRIGDDFQRMIRQTDLDALPPLVHVRLNRVDGTAQDLRHLDVVAPQLDLAEADPGGVH